jgi:hypothetical protein
MATIFGHLNLIDSDYVYNATQGQQVIYDTVKEYVDKINAELSAVMSVFVGETTSDHKRRYRLPGGGYLERVNEASKGGAQKATASWDVAFPLEEFQRGITSTRVSRAYLTVKELDLQVQSVVAANVNTVRFEILKRMFNNVESSFIDPLWGTLLVEPIANGDSVVYPPVLGVATEATDNHFLESGYAAASISDTNNPYATIVAELEEHFGQVSGNENICTFINTAQRAKTEALADYDSFTDRYINPGANTDTLFNFPTNCPGRIIGRTNGTWVCEYNWIPSGWMLGVHMDAPAPLIKRIDPATTGLGDGLQLVSHSDAQFPFDISEWSHRFGFGAGNRLNGVVMELGTGGSYTIPTAYQ